MDRRKIPCYFFFAFGSMLLILGFYIVRQRKIVMDDNFSFRKPGRLIGNDASFMHSLNIKTLESVTYTQPQRKITQNLSSVSIPYIKK